jgi:hypothetical protein
MIFEHDDERRPAGDDFGLVALFSQQRDRVIEACRLREFYVWHRQIFR